MTTISQALQDVAAERERQIAKGYDAAHDDEHGEGALVGAGISFALAATGDGITSENYWPFDGGEPSAGEGTERANMVKAAAMLVAAIEAHDRVRTP